MAVSDLQSSEASSVGKMYNVEVGGEGRLHFTTELPSVYVSTAFVGTDGPGGGSWEAGIARSRNESFGAGTYTLGAVSEGFNEKMAEEVHALLDARARMDPTIESVEDYLKETLEAIRVVRQIKSKAPNLAAWIANS